MSADEMNNRAEVRPAAWKWIVSFVAGAVVAVLVVKMVPSVRHSLGLIDVSPIKDAAQALKTAFDEGFGTEDDESSDAENPASVVTRVEWGQPFELEGRRIRVERAAISRPMRRDFMGKAKASSKDVLVFVVHVKNTTERKILKYVSIGFYTGDEPELKDDAGNELGFLEDLYKNLIANRGTHDDLDPGQGVKLHVPFRTLIHGTKSVVLSFNLEFVDLEGTVEFLVPAAEIAGFEK